MGTSNNSPGGTRTMKASEFKAKCLHLMNEVADKGKRDHHHQERQAHLPARTLPRTTGVVFRR